MTMNTVVMTDDMLDMVIQIFDFGIVRYDAITESFTVPNADDPLGSESIVDIDLRIFGRIQRYLNKTEDGDVKYFTVNSIAVDYLRRRGIIG